MVVAVQVFVPGKYFAPVLKGTSAIVTTPDDHRSAGPHCCVIVSSIRNVSCAGSCPTIRGWIVSATGVRVVASLTSAPDNHLTAGPHRSVTVTTRGRVGCAGRQSNCSCRDCISHLCSAGCGSIRPRQSFGCQSTPQCARIGRRAR